MSPTKITHRYLCELGAKYLTLVVDYRLRCQKAIVEMTSASTETPDVFGINCGNTVLIEVKMSRADFLRDKKKQCRLKSKGVGSTRYYLAPKDLIRIEDLPEKWGLLYYDDGNIKIIKHSKFFERDMIAESHIMYSLIRRLTKDKVLNFRKQ